VYLLFIILDMPRNPLSLVEERRNYAVSLKIAGLSIESIQKQVNAQAASKGWKEVTRRQITQDIADYYRKNKSLTVQDYDHLEQKREAHIDQIEKTIEKLSIHIARKKPNEWKPFEYAEALAQLHKMQMNLAEIQNWNYGRINQFNVNISHNNPNKMFEDAGNELLHRSKPGAVKELANFLQHMIDKIDMEEQGEVIDGEIVETDTN
jgi:hypothetical protein